MKTEAEALIGRNNVVEFAVRTLRNLEFIRAVNERDPDAVHPITHLANSLLGLVVHIHEDTSTHAVSMTKNMPLESIWPRWQEAITPRPESLLVGKFLERVRNIVAHGGITFTGDGKDPAAISLRFDSEWKKPDGTLVVKWSATIRADEMADICSRLVKHLDENR